MSYRRSPAFRRSIASWRVWARTYAVMRGKTGAEYKFVANGAQLYVAEKKLEAVQAGRPKKFLLPKARRMGITTRETLVTCFRVREFRGQHCLAVAHRDQDIESIFKDQAKRCFDKLPSWYQPEYDASNRREILIKDTDSKFSVVSGQAADPGRGGTLQRVHITEAAMVPTKIDMPMQMAGFSEACSEGDLTVESTGKGPVGWFYEECMDALQGRSDYTMIFCPWFLMQEYSEPIPEGLEVIPGVAHRDDLAPFVDDEVEIMERAFREWGLMITPGQLLWRRSKRKTLRKNRLFYQEYPEVIHDCFQASAECFFEIDTLLRLKSLCRKPIQEKRGPGWTWKVWYRPKGRRQYVVAMDVADDGACHTYISVCERKSGKQVAAWHGDIKPKEGGRLAVKIAREYNGALFIPERNNHGISVIDVAETLTGFQLYIHEDDKAGWPTTNQTRSPMLDDLDDSLEEWEPALEINDPLFFDEAMGFRQQSNGKYKGNPDDRVITQAIMLQGRKRRKRPRIRDF